MSEKQSFLGIKKFRERMKLKQNQLAKELGQSPAAYHHWEMGKNDPPFSAVQKLFEMGATVEELFGVAYTGGNSPIENAKITRDQAINIVRAGLAGILHDHSGIIRNSNVLEG
ncbi:MAG: helix-turn-helix transcriptional regulator [Fibromonadaceae bacterium]|jgi:transcriptional regulator with XRE-family HTH domain|nr:helix-turn-helix transcriptional regulator [Fibromonadaceae bacterium]